MRVACIGEGLLELKDRPGGGFDMAYGGDTLCTAVYLARLGIEVDFATAIGDDHHSDWLLGHWATEGVGTGLVRRIHGRAPGLSMVNLLPGGERALAAWREASPARDLFSLPGADDLEAQLAEYDVIYFSGITLSLYDDAGRQRLLEVAREVRSRGHTVAFDPNYRGYAWTSPDAARAAVEAVLPQVEIMLSGLADEQALYGDTHAGMAVRRLHRAGVREVVVKLGAGGALVSSPEGEVAVLTDTKVSPLDTTGAGDAFNAAYLAARLQGMGPREAAQRGNRLAAAVIRHHGAVIPAKAMPNLDQDVRP